MGTPETTSKAHLYRPTENPSPRYIAAETWSLWLSLRSLEPQGELGGIYADKKGYHNTVTRNLQRWPGEYSTRYASDLRGDRTKARAIDWSLPAAQMKLYTKRLFKVLEGPDDPRLDGLREAIGTTDGVHARRYDGTLNKYFVADDSHLWHIHLSFRTAHLHESATYSGVLSILRGESLATWKAAHDG